jgi:hypothetical protein
VPISEPSGQDQYTSSPRKKCRREM